MTFGTIPLSGKKTGFLGAPPGDIVPTLDAGATQERAIEEATAVLEVDGSPVSFWGVHSGKLWVGLGEVGQLTVNVVARDVAPESLVLAAIMVGIFAIMLTDRFKFVAASVLSISVSSAPRKLTAVRRTSIGCAVRGDF